MLGHRKLEIVDYLHILKRRKWLILIPLIILPIAATVYSTFLPPRYTSQTLILIDRQKIPDNYVKPVVSSDLDSRLASMKEQILSRSRLQPIIEKFNLYSNQHMSMDDRIDATRKSIEIKTIPSITGAGGLPGFFILFTANDPHTAQLACNEITSLFLNENARAREASAEGTSDFIRGQLDDAKRSLDDQDAKLAVFQREHFGKLPGEEESNMNMLASLNTQLEAANQALARMEQDRTYMQTMLSQVTSGSITSGSSASPLIPSVPNAQRSAKENELQNLLNEETDVAAHYTADYPDLIALRKRIASLRGQIASMPATVPVGSTSSGTGSVNTLAVQQLKAQLHAADQAIAAKTHEQSELQQSVRTYQDRIQSSPQVEAQFKQLTREYDTAKAFYDALLTKRNDSKMATDLELRQEGEQFRVMDKANLPDDPTFPKRGVFAGGGAAAGLAVGLLLSAFLEYRNTALRTEQDVWTFTKLPTLGIITLNDPVSDAISARNDRRWRKSKRDNSSLADA